MQVLKGPYFDVRPGLKGAITKLGEVLEADPDLGREVAAETMFVIETCVLKAYRSKIVLNRRKDQWYMKLRWLGWRWVDGHLVRPTPKSV